ncbi:uncharacterized protein CC84DRAFT_1263014 [Paraphaeosphaeria sporulosa]|uniref:Uncharacterized protein n=1 Tax=Paraphaeosphaeria sporulosa TaxID=1460663 RepID=A0A177C223_9PLEO|nr:uncharacterized protein CC84DRAFT_1263014 [Paraphaeosphaeria sporulosa]OAG00939.1 hypothetical protein CC84DRAFT_1263014 [Paraphaeosphaeria sporulosa]
MRPLAILSPTLAIAVPASNKDTPAAVIARFTHSDECQLPSAPATCAGSSQKDVIVHYGKNTTQAEKDLLLNAAKASGASIHEAMNNFGFTGFVPESVVELIAAHGKTCGVSVYENGCAGIPWCGEAPC